MIELIKRIQMLQELSKSIQYRRSYTVFKNWPCFEHTDLQHLGGLGGLGIQILKVFIQRHPSTRSYDILSTRGIYIVPKADSNASEISKNDVVLLKYLCSENPDSPKPWDPWDRG